MNRHSFQRKTFLLLSILMFGLVSFGNSAPRSVESSVYALEIKDEKEPGEETLRLFHRRSGRTIWTRKVWWHSSIGWASDKRALAIGANTAAGTEGNILTWRPGGQLRVFKIPDDDFGDYFMGFAWSPDKRRLLFRTGGSGDADIDTGLLLCLNLDNGRFYKVTKQGVRKMAWAGRRKALYWTVTWVTSSPGYRQVMSQVVSKTPHVWNCP